MLTWSRILDRVCSRGSDERAKPTHRSEWCYAENEKQLPPHHRGRTWLASAGIAAGKCRNDMCFDTSCRKRRPVEPAACPGGVKAHRAGREAAGRRFRASIPAWHDAAAVGTVPAASQVASLLPVSPRCRPHRRRRRCPTSKARTSAPRVKVKASARARPSRSRRHTSAAYICQCCGHLLAPQHRITANYPDSAGDCRPDPSTVGASSRTLTAAGAQSWHARCHKTPFAFTRQTRFPGAVEIYFSNPTLKKQAADRLQLWAKSLSSRQGRS
jgi:hypothetical protein